MSKVFQKKLDSSDKLIYKEIPDKDSKDFKFYRESKVYKDGKFVSSEDQYPPEYKYWAVYKNGEFFVATKSDGHLCLNKVRMSDNDFNELKKTF